MNVDLETKGTPVTFTDRALDELHELKKRNPIDSSLFLRIGVKGGGCSGMSYLLAYDAKDDMDNEYLINTIPVVINKAHVMYVLGMQIDWTNGLNNRGFEFVNPNAKSTCGCGESFST